MRVFEREGKPNVELHKVIYRDHAVTTILTEGTEEKTIRKFDKVHQDFLDAFKAAGELLSKKFRIKERDSIAISVTALEFAEGEGWQGYKISFIQRFKALENFKTKGKTPAFYIPAPGYFDALDKNGKPVHRPDDEPQELTDEEIETIEKIFSEAYAYLYENKVKPDDQMDLFTDAEAALTEEEKAASVLKDAGNLSHDEIINYAAETAKAMKEDVEQLITDANIKEIKIGDQVVYKRDDDSELDDEGDIESEDKEEDV